MKKVLTISERGELAQQLQSNEHFYTDIKLYNEFFPGSKLSSQLAKANEHNMPSLHSRMLYDLLSQVDPEDVLNNRKPVELQIVEKTDLEKAEELKNNIVDQIKLSLYDGISVEDIKKTICNKFSIAGDPIFDESELNDLVDRILRVWISKNPDRVLTKVDETNVNDTKVDDTKVDETNVDDTKVDETKVDDTKVDETKVDETNVADALVAEVTNVTTSTDSPVTDAPIIDAPVTEVTNVTTSTDAQVADTPVDEVTNVPTTEETKEESPVVEDEKKSVKKATNSPK